MNQNPSSTPISGLPQMTRHITTHNEQGKAAVQSSEELKWDPYDQGNMGFSVLYTTSSMPADLNNDTDVTTHHNLVSSGNLGLVNPNGTVLRVVDFAPGYACDMHRTQSLDYGIVMEGEVDMELDSGDVRRMKKGDVAIQRATFHAWKNASATNWARMIFVLQDCKQLIVNGEKIGEDTGRHSEIPASGN